MKRLIVKAKKYIVNSVFNEPPLPLNPFGNKPHASTETYLKLHAEVNNQHFPEIDHFEKKYGFAVDKQWLDNLALHTQVVIKESKLNYSHGRILYTALRKHLSEISVNNQSAPFIILETGTARGFSSICMSKALVDSNTPGFILTIDVVPHNAAIYWNCIDDQNGPKSRQKLLHPWNEEIQRIVFIQGWTKSQLNRTGLSHINFAFLDAQHTKEDVLFEYEYVRDRQSTGDIIVFDDVTDGVFDGVVQAVDAIEASGEYAIERIKSSESRGYAIGRKV